MLCFEVSKIWQIMAFHLHVDLQRHSISQNYSHIKMIIQLCFISAMKHMIRNGAQQGLI